ncbi:MAG: hypothetical protein ACOYKD_00585 [Anaerolineaceae bacterium]|jgi:nucleotide-binding universal stress UspA family protein
MENDFYTYRSALLDFRKARSKAAMQRFWSAMQGKSTALLPFDEISLKLKALNKTDRGLQVIPLNLVVGSVGRTDDFDRDFLPLNDSDEHRWASVKTAMTSPSAPGLPPITVYKIGEAYFVLDGNHRVSISKQMGMEEIEAYVVELKSRVPITGDLTPEDLVRKSAYVGFLEDTKADIYLPGVDLSLNLIDNYPLLKEHIHVHHYYMGLERKADVSEEEALLHWYDEIYAPVVKLVQSSGLQQAFPQLTLTDLYLWVLDQQSALQEAFGLPVRAAHTVDFLTRQEGKIPAASLSRAEEHIGNVLSSPAEPDSFNTMAEGSRDTDCLFREILVALGNTDPDWAALDQAILMSQCEHGTIRGVHILPEDNPLNPREEEIMQSRFDETLRRAGRSGKLQFLEGKIAQTLEDHSIFSDLLVLKLTYPPTGNILERLSSGMISLIQNSLRPILVVKEQAIPITSLLLLFDGSSKSKQALYVAAYLTARRNYPLHILTVETGIPDIQSEISFAKTYLRKLNLDFTYELQTSGELVETVQAVVEREGISTVISGGYSGSSLLTRLFSTSVDRLLQKVNVPILICQ